MSAQHMAALRLASTRWTQRLQAENAELRARLEESEDMLRALRGGDVDAIVVGSTVYTLEGADAASNRFRGEALAHMSEAIVSCDNEGRITYLNAAAERLYRREASSVLGNRLDALFHQLTLKDAGWRDVECGERGPFVHRRSDGTEIVVEASTSVMRDAAGCGIGVLTVVRDVTARVQAERGLREADGQKNRFIATLAHELRNPLAPIGYSLAIMRSASDRTHLDQARHVIERQLDQLTRLVDDLLDVSRITHDKLVLRTAPMDLRQAVHAAVETSRPLIERRGQHLALELGDAPERVEGDLARLTQVVANLLNNSAKYSPEGAHIRVALRRDGDTALLQVSDDGIGIDPEAIGSIFDMFRQVRGPGQAAQGGLGIGLTLVRRLVQLHGGTVTAHSAGVGHGVDVTVRLPALAAADSDGESQADRDPAARMPPAPLKILVADDDRDNVEALSSLLAVMGYETRTAANGVEAVQVAREWQPRIAFLDVGMPVLDGHGAARQIRAEPWGAGITLVAVTGWGQEEDRRRTREAGFDQHLVKPFDPRLLDELIARATAR